MTDATNLDAIDPNDMEFARAGAERVVLSMGDDHRARAAMIYAHVTALAKLVGEAGSELSKAAYEQILSELPSAYRSAFILDTLNEVAVEGYDTPAIRDQALAGTERGQAVHSQKPKLREYKVMTVALTDAQKTANALGQARWTYEGQSTPIFPPRSSEDRRPEAPAAVVFTFGRDIDEKKTDVRTTPADNPVDQREADGRAAPAEAAAGDGGSGRRDLPVLG